MALVRLPHTPLPYVQLLALAASVLTVGAFVEPALAEPVECLSFNPADWPAPARPYFMLVVDTSGSMIACTTPPTDWPTECNAADPMYKLNSCGMNPSRINDAKCALRQTVQAFSGEVNFGLATYNGTLNCPTPGTCVSACAPFNGGTCNADDYTNCSLTQQNSGCGILPNCSAAGPALPNLAKNTWRNGANIAVPLLQDPVWLPPPPPANNTTELLKYFDGLCDESKELWASGGTPIAGSLRASVQYLRAGWANWTTTNYCAAGLTYNYGTPLNSLDRPCRSVNVILLTDGDESCDNQAAAIAAAQDLYQNGVTLGGINWKVPVHVINFAGGSVTATDQIAAAGGTIASVLATDEVTLAQALANIVGGANKPEVCDNTDNNCNGCTDEGYKHYCDTGQTCCAWSTQAQRTTCLNNYKASIPGTPPDGNLALLPCTTPAQQQDPANWLCYNPKEACDNVDNNCQDGTDEGVLKCGNPLHCPTTEICNADDDDCDGLTDEGVCPSCTPTPEICDGCDNDCDGMADDGAPSQPCGFQPPANCLGTQLCNPAQPVGTPGGCIAGGGYQPCNNMPQPEICDMIDNNCNGIIDDGIPALPCPPPGAGPGTVYGPPSQCVMGTQPCGGTCQGGIGPSAEVCDGIDNDCDGIVDDNPFGVGQSCGLSTPPCTPGITACVNGAIVCSGGTGPQPEVCDGADNDCDTLTDEAPLADGPAPGSIGCWTLPGNCCTFDGLSWCPPPGATCTGSGSLVPPCGAGTLACVSGSWTCQGSSPPSPEICDGLDNNCNGAIDDGIPPTPCLGTNPPGLDYGPNSQCKMGTLACGGTCIGVVGPSAEICDGIDNDCDGVVDDNVPGVGGSCGLNIPPCTPGVTVCINGAITCQGGTAPNPEVCDGIDNDCNGTIDNGPLTDAPPAGQTGCWNLPGNCCTFDGLSWCPPPGATCNDNGSLALPCNKGQIVCASGGWTCQNPVTPNPEVCDALDNDCDGLVDEGNLPQEGEVCGTDVGECQPGVLDCNNGILDCVGDIGPTPEICDNLDNNCNGQIDDGIPFSGTCDPVYDMNDYPGDRNHPPCKPGLKKCVMGVEVCEGGIGPSPEVCDGLDNDCDTQIDEAGMAPDGMDGTPNPFPPPMANIGDACGVDVGLCQAGMYACINGLFTCLGQTPPTPEQCDCNDNDCDGANDNENPPPLPTICGPSKDCVKTANGCQCAELCMQGEWPCPPGQICTTVTDSETGMMLPGEYCVTDFCPGGCAAKTGPMQNGIPVCAPAGTMLPNCVKVPECECHGQDGCQDPCFGKTCGSGQLCAQSGPNKGQCVANNCYNIPCPGCDQVCNNSSCVDNPCEPNPCLPDEVCKPNGTFTDHTCVPSCAGVMCPSGEKCVEGTCVSTCNPPCGPPTVCDEMVPNPSCVPADQCVTTGCADGKCCDPVAGCGNCPCEGVVCPACQVCQADECVDDPNGCGGSGGSTSSSASVTASSASSASAGSGGSGAGGAGGAPPDDGIWGLPTGGGGCACQLGDRSQPTGLLFGALAFALTLIRRKRSRSDAEVVR